MTGQVRLLPLVPPPTPGEAFVSWIDRLARPYQLTRLEMCQELELTTNRFVHHLGITISAHAQQVIAEATGVTEANDMLLARYDNR